MVVFRDTANADLPFVLQLENADENAGFVRQWPEEQHRRAIADENIAHFIVESAATGEPVGYLILIGLLNADHSLYFKRIVIRDKGQGYGRAAVRLIKRYAFEMLKMHRLWLEVAEDNERAFRLYETEGFSVEGMHRESMKRGDRFVSFRIMSMLADEYVPSA